MSTSIKGENVNEVKEGKGPLKCERIKEDTFLLGSKTQGEKSTLAQIQRNRIIFSWDTPERTSTRNHRVTYYVYTGKEEGEKVNDRDDAQRKTRRLWTIKSDWD